MNKIFIHSIRELPGERDNARNNTRYMQARKDNMDGQHQGVDRTPVEESIRMTKDRDKWCGNPRIEDG